MACTRCEPSLPLADGRFTIVHRESGRSGVRKAGGRVNGTPSPVVPGADPRTTKQIQDGCLLQPPFAQETP
ncbi:hypothetical protein BHE74_00014053 [Ensete ventricosum]|uniref:Uncharacterized protein n=1 Tax=Ensete ventricosum TaxID=4639 RepID=A0A444F527_ENSVE|nr:hypothetical protein GW17_00018315 [Ensete ventricosum]RWW77759.1 hypothetical protein BHE74_00014053 [Ensete ventricosum]RZR71375.1 hypothetical protein BHM03_00004868 [Ensete ventricosum]